jgi:hypothetical protein
MCRDTALPHMPGQTRKTLAAVTAEDNCLHDVGTKMHIWENPGVTSPCYSTVNLKSIGNNLGDAGSNMPRRIAREMTMGVFFSFSRKKIQLFAPLFDHDRVI